MKLIRAISNCLIYEVYGLVVEDFFYFDIYTADLCFYSNIDRLLSVFESKKIQTVYHSQIAKRQNVLIPYLQVSQLQSNREFTLKAEQHFFTMLQLMDELLPDVLYCKQSLDKQHCTEIFENKKKELMSLLNIV